MFKPVLRSGKKVSSVLTEAFGGINRTDTIGENEFSEMRNCGLDCFPYVSGRIPRMKLGEYENIQFIGAPVYGDDEYIGFTGIANGKFYYGGRMIDSVNLKSDVLAYPFNDSEEYPEINSDFRNFTVNFKNNVYIFPGNSYYSRIEDSINTMGYSETYDGVSVQLVLHSKFSDESGDYPENARVWLTLNNSGKKQFGYADEENTFKVGDRISIRYDTNVYPNNNTFDDLDPYLHEAVSDKGKFRDGSWNTEVFPCIVSCYITEIETADFSSSNTEQVISKIYLELKDINDKPLVFFKDANNFLNGSSESAALVCDFPVTVSKYIPPIQYACEYNGRLFALDPYGKRIMACKFDDADTWLEYSGAPGASWYTDIPSSGKWTGICSFSSYLYCFKRDLIYVLYGDNASNYSVVRTINHGCIDGRSIQVINQCIYYLGSDGFYACSGGQPYRISEKLGRKYTKCVSGGLGALYYCSCEYDGGHELMVYDTEKQIWVKEDEFDAVGFVIYGSKLYGADTGGKFFCFGEGEGADGWSVTSKKFNDSTSLLRSVCSLCFRLRMDGGAKVTVYVEYDSEGFRKCAEISGGMITLPQTDTVSIDGVIPGTLHKALSGYFQRVPVRFRGASGYRYRLECYGGVVLEGVERNIVTAGKLQR